MSTPEDPTPEKPATGESGESDWQRQRRLAEVFGDVMPETTSDERDDESTDTAGAERGSEAWLKAQVPPHHG